jgi:hypothetical protein
VQLYTAAQLKVIADAMIGPWLIQQVKAEIAAEERPATQGLLLNEIHAQNGAAK